MSSERSFPYSAWAVSCWASSSGRRVVKPFTVLAIGVVAMILRCAGRRRKQEGKPTLIDPDLFRSKVFGWAFPDRCSITSPWAVR